MQHLLTTWRVAEEQLLNDDWGGLNTDLAFLVSDVLGEKKMVGEKAAFRIAAELLPE